MKKEYVRPQAVLVESLDIFCAVSLSTSGEYGLDHSDIIDDLYE